MSNPATESAVKDLDQLREAIKKMPKVELHRHVEGAIRFTTLVYYYLKDVQGWDEAKCRAATESKSGVLTWDTVEESKLSETDKAVIALYCVPTRIENLTAFLKKFEDTRKLFRDTEFIQRMAYENVEDCFNEGTRVVELRYSPSYIRDSYKNMSLDEIHDAMIRGIKLAQDKYDIAVGLIGILDRSYEPKAVMEDLDFIIARKADFVAVDLANDEVSNPVMMFKDVFDKARKHGFNITVHSGEVVHPEGHKWINLSVNELGAQRIGHGIMIANDKEGSIIQNMLDKNIVFEVCPSSNYLLHGAETLEKHPLITMRAKGLKVTVNTDDPGLFLTNMNKEVELLVTRMGLSLADVEDMMQVAYDASFIPASVKSKFWTPRSKRLAAA